MRGDLETLVYPSQLYAECMQQYADFFASLFGSECIVFGYERLSKNGFYESISNKSRIAELFIDTKAYQIMQFIHKKFCYIEHGFIYPNESTDHQYAAVEQSIYNQFRKQLDKELDLYATFYVLEPCLNFQHIFVWNFKAPLKSISLTAWENQILLCFMNNKRSIQYTLDHFKKFYYQTVSRQIVPIKLLNSTPEQKTKNSSSILDEKLIETHWLEPKDLYLKNIDLSPKETLCIHFYLQGMSAKEIAMNMFVSNRTVEDYIKRIKQKLKVQSRSALHATIEKINLWKNII